MSPSDDLTVSQTADSNRDHQDVQTLVGDRFPSRKTQGIYQHPPIRSLIARHCEQLSSGLVDIFRTEVEREVKQRVSEVIVSEASTLCEQLRSKEEALLAAETRCKDLREQLELSNEMCSQLQERVKRLEAAEAELRVALNEQLEVQRAGVDPPQLESRHLTVVYERKDNRVLCRLCVHAHSKDEALPVISFQEDVKPSALAWHIQHKHPQDCSVLLNMEEDELSQVATEMSRVGS
ncbi:hypothetical protein BJ322DRAFT_1074243 [Thelephora terrestris]|uniref:Uncharacterized protein n=1 Tax=Thelephora terrestris TaxID=56493 RepID=A0A9P6L499_9AGAM|nr:hypothetical protein BJ322DRAFT_1074243 [Thelephora terrestris]